MGSPARRPAAIVGARLHENMRERLIGLIGPRSINVTTQALSEASYRVSRYLFMQLVVNACFGIPFGIALHLIGIPNAMLWGLLATLLRFIPYAGVWIAVAMPALLAFAISDGWSEVAWVLGVFLFLELVLVNFVEPLVYGRSAGLAPISIILAALFWTWLWGPIGLLLSTPLTMCLVVLGRHVEHLQFLDVLLGDKPPLSAEQSLYIRLLGDDADQVRGFAADAGEREQLVHRVRHAAAKARQQHLAGLLHVHRFVAIEADGINQLLHFRRRQLQDRARRGRARRPARAGPPRGRPRRP